MSAAGTTTDSAILAEVLTADHGNFAPEVARAILKWKFTARSIKRINRLAERNRHGVITDSERDDLQRYLRVGELINLMQAKARLSLKLSGTEEA